MKYLYSILDEIKSVEKLNKTDATKKSTPLGFSWERNNEGEIEINSDEHLIFISQKTNFQKKKTKQLIPSNYA